MSPRRILLAMAFAVLLVAPGKIRAQAPSASAAPTKDHPFRDFEKQPPTNLGAELEPIKGWETAERPALIRTHRPPTLSGARVSPETCELLVKDDWLRVWCKGPTGRVHQLAGDTANAVVHIANQIVRTSQAGDWDDRRRVALYVRMVPGEVTVLEVTSVLTGGYNGDWEGPSSYLTVDWSDTEQGPRIHILEPGISYMH